MTISCGLLVDQALTNDSQSVCELHLALCLFLALVYRWCSRRLLRYDFKARDTARIEKSVDDGGQSRLSAHRPRRALESGSQKPASRCQPVKSSAHALSVDHRRNGISDRVGEAYALTRRSSQQSRPPAARGGDRVSDSGLRTSGLRMSGSGYRNKDAPRISSFIFPALSSSLSHRTTRTHANGIHALTMLFNRARPKQKWGTDRIPPEYRASAQIPH